MVGCTHNRLCFLWRIFITTTILSAPGLTFADIDTREGIFDPDIRSVTMRNPDNLMAPAVIRLGTNDRLSLNFDIIGDAHEYLRYRLLHCNADWTPSRLLESEYVDGFNEDNVEDYAYSSNTYIHYVNYNISLPNEHMPIIASGNYLLQVFPEDNPETILLQTRFAVTENTSAIIPKVSTHTDRGFNTDWQQLDITVDLGNLSAVNPYQDLVVTVTQNNRPETTSTTSHPLQADGGKVHFSHDQNLIFPAGNEYRRFETVRVDYPGMSVDSVVFGPGNWHAWLSTDQPRYDKSYIYDNTQHGKFAIDEYNSTDPDLGADYVSVHFTLDMPEIPGADIYVDGDFNLHRFDRRNKMEYDHNTGTYTATIPLKQGSYNYQYITLPKYNTPLPQRELLNPSDRREASDTGALKADASVVEGNFHETINEYLVKVFLRLPGARADRLIGSAICTK